MLEKIIAWCTLSLVLAALVPLGGLVAYKAGDSAGAARVQAAWNADKQARTDRAKTITTEVKEAEPIIIEKVVEVEKKVYVQGKTITKEIPVYVSTQADAACTVPLGFVSVYDRANSAPSDAQGDTARATDAASASDADAVRAPEWIAEPSGLPLSRIAEVNAANAAEYKALAARHAGLVEWAGKSCYLPVVPEP